jgi:hypothetical protein
LFTEIARAAKASLASSGALTLSGRQNLTKDDFGNIARLNIGALKSGLNGNGAEVMGGERRERTDGASCGARYDNVAVLPHVRETPQRNDLVQLIVIGPSKGTDIINQLACLLVTDGRFVRTLALGRAVGGILSTFPTMSRAAWAVCSAIICSSSVLMTKTKTSESGALITCEPFLFAILSIRTPIQSMSLKTASRIRNAFSPIQPVKTIPSTPLSVAARPPISRRTRATK